MLNYEITKFSLNEIHMVEKKMCHWKKFTYRERNNLKECKKSYLLANQEISFTSNMRFVI